MDVSRNYKLIGLMRYSMGNNNNNTNSSKFLSKYKAVINLIRKCIHWVAVRMISNNSSNKVGIFLILSSVVLQIIITTTVAMPWISIAVTITIIWVWVQVKTIIQIQAVRRELWASRNLKQSMCLLK